ncbi:membrane protein [Paenibacillus sp. IHBB 10380]|nr:membrane protein [Paenibacillus sp. IHBB 10380]
MKEFKDRLLFVQDHQRKLMKEYQDIINEYESNDLIHENQVLREQYEEMKLSLTKLQDKTRHMEEENVQLRSSLTEQIYNEKLNIIHVSREKLEIYFAARANSYANRLETFEDETKLKFRKLFDQASSQLKEEKEATTARLTQMSTELNDTIMKHRVRLKEDGLRLRQYASMGLDQLGSEEISEEVMQKRIKQNQFEMKIGLNWISKLGMLLLILAVGVAFKYTYSDIFNGYMKGSTFFLLGALMLVSGEWLFRKQRQTFALVLLGGGISVLYGSIFYSYFLLHIIDIVVGLSLSVLVSITAVLLSLRFHSRTICSLGLVGGYLPLFSYMGAFGLEGNAVYAAMVYLFLLNGFILLVSFRQRWVIVNYISFMFNVPSMIALVAIAQSEAVGMLYVVITFMMYLGITLVYPFKVQTKLSWWDFTLLALNTTISCGTLYVLFAVADLEDFNGLLALVFCLVYIGLGRFVEKFMQQEKQTTLLFYATSLTFAVLMIPFQFGVQWLSMGWLVEGILLTIYGNLNRFKPLEKAGWGILALCLGTFLWVDILANHLVDYQDVYFALKYTFVAIGMLMVTLFYAHQEKRHVAYLYNRPIEARMITYFKYVTLVNTWFYLLYEAAHLYHEFVPYDVVHYNFYQGLMSALLTIALAYTLMKITVLYDRIVKYYSLFLYGVGYIICLGVTMALPALSYDHSDNGAAEYIALGVLIGFNVLVFFGIRDFLIAFIRQQYKSIEFYPVILGIYLLGILTTFLMVQLQLTDVGLIFSMLYLLLAIVYITFGFRYKYVYIRRLGLGLTLFSTGKLLLYDLSMLTTGSKIVAYFCFGLVLLGISYAYQKVSSRMGEPQHAQEQLDSKS